MNININVGDDNGQWSGSEFHIYFLMLNFHVTVTFSTRENPLTPKFWNKNPASNGLYKLKASLFTK